MVRIFTDSDPPPGAKHTVRVRRIAVVGFVALAIGAAVLALAILGSESLRGELLESSGAATPRDLARAVALAPLHLAQAAVAPRAVPRLRLDVKFKHMHAIHEQREAALRSGMLTTSDSDLVPAHLDAGGGPVSAKLRLLGDRIEALEGEKWPLHVQTKGDDHVFGVRRMALVPPEGRDFQPADAFLDELRSEGVVAPRSFLVDVVLNGKRLGLMVLRELPAFELLAHQQRRDGPLLRFDSVPDGPGGAQVAALAPLRPRVVAESRTLRKGFELAAKLLEAQFAGDLAAGDVFDVELWARFLATVEAWGARDAVEWRNLRFYFNPLTARLEPLGLVVTFAGRENGDESVLRTAPFAQRLLADERIAAATERALTDITGKMGEPAFAAALLEADDARTRALHREYPLRLPFDIAPLRRRAARLHGRAPALADAVVRAPQRSGDKIAPLAGPSLEKLLARHEFLSWDPTTRMLRAAAGRWEVDGSLILPEGVGLALEAGTVLRFEARHGIIARGPLEFRGREDAPVVLEGPAAEKRSHLWSGVYVVESERPSRWTHVVVRNTGGWKRRGWTLASGVVFRRTRVELEHCAFSGDRTEDSVSVVRASFGLKEVRITEAESDGFDSDYSEGSIRGGYISQVGGDAIDLGGSQVEISGTRISQARDKALAVGEGSRLAATGLEIDHVGIGIASKNGAQAEITDSTLRNVRDVAFVAYTNQPEYGPGALVASANHVSGSSLPALAQTGSRVVLDGVALRPVDAAVERLYKD